MSLQNLKIEDNIIPLLK